MRNNQTVFGKDADQAIRQLEVAIDEVNERLPAKELIDSSAMQIVRDKAAEVLKLIENSGINVN